MKNNRNDDLAQFLKRVRVLDQQFNNLEEPLKPLIFTAEDKEVLASMRISWE